MVLPAPTLARKSLASNAPFAGFPIRTSLATGQIGIRRERDTLSVTEISPGQSDDKRSMHAWLSPRCSVLLRKSAMLRLDRTTQSAAPASHHLIQVSNIAHYKPCCDAPAALGREKGRCSMSSGLPGSK